MSQILNMKISHVQNKHVDNVTDFFLQFFSGFSLSQNKTTGKIEKRVD